jgi:hypothetical protein
VTISHVMMGVPTCLIAFHTCILFSDSSTEVFNYKKYPYILSMARDILSALQTILARVFIDITNVKNFIPLQEAQ